MVLNFRKLKFLLGALSSSGTLLKHVKMTVGMQNHGMLVCSKGKPCPLLDAEHFGFLSIACGGNSGSGVFGTFFLVENEVILRYFAWGNLEGFGGSLRKYFNADIYFYELFNMRDKENHRRAKPLQTPHSTLVQKVLQRFLQVY